jgi:hypothetical protein
MRLRARPTPQWYDQDDLGIRSQLELHWRAQDLGVRPLTGQQLLAFARDSTSTGLDHAGNAYTAPPGYATWAIVDGRCHIRLNYGSSREDWRYSWHLPPSVGMIGYVELIDRGTAGDAVLHAGAGTTDTSSLTLRKAAGGAWELAIRTAGGLSVSTAGSSTTGDRVRLYWVLTPDGQMQLSRATGDGEMAAGTEVTGLTLPAAWEEPEIRMGHMTLAGSGRIDLRTVKLAAWAPPAPEEAI